MKKVIYDDCEDPFCNGDCPTCMTILRVDDSDVLEHKIEYLRREIDILELKLKRMRSDG